MSDRDASRLARDHTESAIQTLVGIMEDDWAEHKDRLRAAEALLDRGHGKAAQAVIAIPANLQLAAALATMSDEELTGIINAQPLPRMITVTPEAQPDPLLG